MKVSQFVVKTLREVPASAELPSHIFMLRGGYIKQLSAGLYSILPLGKRVLKKIEKIIRQEMEAIGGQEIDLPLVHPAELWRESGRLDAIGNELLRFKDRVEHPMVLAMTHEEAVTDLARYIVSSYKQLPFMVYQFKLKFRDEPRARGGLIRVREFIMKDAYSFHTDEKDLDEYYNRAHKAYLRIFNRMGIDPVVVQSDTGIMGGKIAHEFMLESPNGEDNLIISEDGSYKANQEIAEFDRESKSEPPLPLKKVATPGQRTIQELCEFLKINSRQTAKAVMYQYKERLILVIIRGDLDTSPTKIRNFLKIPELITAEDAFIRQFGLVPGFASAVNISAKNQFELLVDESVAEGSNFVTGANEEGFHLANVNFGRDFQSENVGDFALADSGHKCKNGNSRLRAVKGIEIGNIFKLGTKFSTSMKAEFLNEKGKSLPLVMGCYGIGLGRLAASIVEHRHDEFGPIWPKAVAPFQVHLISIGQDPNVVSECENLYSELMEEEIEVLYDDRDERPGVKFKDADLWGVPIRIGISPKTLRDSACEWKHRSKKTIEKVPLNNVLAQVKYFISQEE